MWLIDSGCNRHISPFREDFKSMRGTDVTCTFGNNGKLKAEGIGEVEISVIKKSIRDDQPEICRLILKDVLYIPELQTRLISSGRLRKTGGKFIESNNGSVLQTAGGQEVIPLTERRIFLWLVTVIESEKTQINTAYAPREREMTSASLLDWHETLGHCNPTSILYLGQRGLINVTGNKKLTALNCRLCKEYKSTIPHYQRGTRSPKRPGDTAST